MAEYCIMNLRTHVKPEYCIMNLRTHVKPEYCIMNLRTHVKPRHPIASASMSPSSDGHELRAGK